MKPQISVITINYNGIKDTRALIQSLMQNVKKTTFEIIVVDNASKNNEAEQLQTEFPNIKVIASKENLGFSGGNNLGIKYATADFLFFINNDTYIADDSLHYLLERMDYYQYIAGVCPKIRFAFGEQLIQFAGYTPLTPITLRNKAIGCGEPDSEEYDTPRGIPLMHGAAMLIRRSTLKNVGLMPENYFLYYEEIDWSTRFDDAEYEMWYEPRCTIFHKESQSTGQNSPLRAYYLTRNRLRFAMKHRKHIIKCLSILYLIFVAGSKDILKNLTNKKPKLAKATLLGIWDFLVHPNKKAINVCRL